MSVLQDSQKKTTVLRGRETVKTGENMAENTYFFVTLHSKTKVITKNYEKNNPINHACSPNNGWSSTEHRQYTRQ